MTRLVLGLIADTHGLLRPEAVAALGGMDRILHAGDIGDPAILAALGEIAPVTAIRGNIDKGAWAAALPERAVVAAAGASLLMLHDVKTLDLDPAAAGFQAVIAGHSHQPGIRTEAGVLYVNPGSAGPRRFRLPISVARLVAADGALEAELITLR